MPLDAAARELQHEALDVTAAIMRSPGELAKDRLAAAKEIMNRGSGMPTSTVLHIPVQRAVKEALADMTDEQLAERLNRATLNPRALAVIAEDATPIDPLLA